MLAKFTKHSGAPIWIESFHVLSVEAVPQATNPSEVWVRMVDGAVLRIRGAVDDVAQALVAVPLLVKMVGAPDPISVKITNTLADPVFTDEKNP